jgi:hypothetical protein
VFDWQLGFKITANSLYGQCGAKTSSFYDKDIAASTTATGRKLLIYGKEEIEGVYKNRVCEMCLRASPRDSRNYLWGYGFLLLQV